jgi:hypothetical protein
MVNGGSGNVLKFLRSNPCGFVRENAYHFAYHSFTSWTFPMPYLREVGMGDTKLFGYLP